MRCNSIRVVMSMVCNSDLAVSSDKQQKVSRHFSTCFGDAFGVQNGWCNFDEAS